MIGVALAVALLAQEPHALRGRASWYGRAFAGRPTANGEIFHPDSLTMAHRTLPFGTRVRVVNLRNGRSVEVRVNDRGPWDSTRVADLSERAARELGMWRRGLARVRLEILGGPRAAR